MDHPQLNWIANFIWGIAVPRKPLPLHQLVYFCSAEVVQIYSALDRPGLAEVLRRV